MMTLKSISSLIHKENIRLGSVDQCLGHWVHLVTFNTRVKNTMKMVQRQSIENVFECVGRCIKNQGGEEQEQEQEQAKSVRPCRGTAHLNQTNNNKNTTLNKNFFFQNMFREQDEWYKYQW